MEQGITIVSIFIAVGMSIDVLLEALLGGSTVSITTTTSDGDGKGGGAKGVDKKQIESFITIIR